jgi:hypothetical protein
VAALQKQLDDFKKLHDASNVEATLAILRQHLAKPPVLFDPFTAMAALEQLVDTARDKGDDRASRFNVVLKQCRPLVGNPALQNILLKLVGNKDEIDVANEIQKAFKNAPVAAANRPAPYPQQRLLVKRRQPVTCFNCGKRGHIARNCWSPPNQNQRNNR